MDFSIVIDLFIIFALALVVNIVFQRVRMPSILGFIIAGILAGPHVFGLETNPHDIELLSEIGIMLLLFTIGIEFSIKDLMTIRKTVFLGGGIQVFFTIISVYALSAFAGFEWQQSLFFGFLISLSSTAIVLRVMQEQSMLNKPYGKGSLGILIFQDLMVVPMILLVPFFSGTSENPSQEFIWMFVKVAGFILFAIFGSRYLIPPILHIVAKTQRQDFFLLTVLIIGFGTALLSYSLGLSLALGAFLAGLIISETDYNHEAFGNIVPFRDIFTSFFFVLIGMFVNLEFITNHIGLILILSAIVFTLKTLITSLAGFLSGYRFGVAIILGISLSQVGEFSIILAQAGLHGKIITEYYHQLFLNVAIISMVVAPFVIQLWPSWIEKILPSTLFHKRLLSKSDESYEENFEKLKGHLVIIGMGLNGHNIAYAAKYAKIPYVIIDNDADLVDREKQNGEPIIFGSAENISILKEVGVENAGNVVIAIRNPGAIYAALRNVRKLNDHAYVIVRTRLVEEMESLYKYGATEVIPEEFETSVEIFSLILKHNLVPSDEIRQMTAHLRENGYGMFRKKENEQTNTFVPPFTISAVKVTKGSETCGATIKELKETGKFSDPILAIHRNNTLLTSPEDTIKLIKDDILVILGKPEDLACQECIFDPENTKEINLRS